MSNVPVTQSMVLGRTRAPDLRSVHKLNLFGSGVNAAGVLADGSMSLLQALSASCNEFDDEALAEICNGCPGIEELYLRGNRISQLASLGALANLSRLRIIWLAHNPVCTELSNQDMRTLLCHIVGPGLEILDNEGECGGVLCDRQLLLRVPSAPTKATPAPSAPHLPSQLSPMPRGTVLAPATTLPRWNWQ